MNLIDKGNIQITDEQAEQIARAQEAADREDDPKTGSQMIAMRWGRQQLRMVKRAAELRGIPYQLYIRNAAWEMAAKDLEKESLLATK